MKIAVIREAGSGHANLILAGVYGSLQRQEDTQTEGAGTFTIAPEFHRISSLFGLLDNGAAPIDVSTVREYDVPDDLGNVFKANLMKNLSHRWSSLYDKMTGGHLDTLTKTMLLSEHARVRAGVVAHLASMGMRDYEVVVKVRAQSSYRACEYATLEELARGMSPLPDAIAEIVSVQQAQSTDEAAGDVDQISQEQEDLTLVPQPWHYENHYAAGDLYRTLMVKASSEDQARLFAQYILSRNSVREEPISQLLTQTALRVENVSMGEEIEYEDDADEDWDLLQRYAD